MEFLLLDNITVELIEWKQEIYSALRYASYVKMCFISLPQLFL